MVDSEENEQARTWVAAEIAKWRALPYEELAEREGDALHVEVKDRRGKVWIRETQIFWDDLRRRTIRVMVDV